MPAVVVTTRYQRKPGRDDFRTVKIPVKQTFDFPNGDLLGAGIPQPMFTVIADGSLEVESEGGVVARFPAGMWCAVWSEDDFYGSSVEVYA